MQRLVDLDAVAAQLQARRAQWAARGLKVGAFTWRDAQAPWPQPIVSDRELVSEPESLGLTMSASADREAELVLWRGGWADLACLIDGQALVQVPEFHDDAGCVAVADWLADRLLSGAHPGTDHGHP
jgi:hypothetical protein